MIKGVCGGEVNRGESRIMSDSCTPFPSLVFGTSHLQNALPLGCKPWFVLCDRPDPPPLGADFGGGHWLSPCQFEVDRSAQVRWGQWQRSAKRAMGLLQCCNCISSGPRFQIRILQGCALSELVDPQRRLGEGDEIALRVVGSAARVLGPHVIVIALCALRSSTMTAASDPSRQRTKQETC
jgi:hypothetical protein